MILVGSPPQLDAWTRKWDDADLQPSWIKPPFFYHECLGRLSKNGELRIEDELGRYPSRILHGGELGWNSIVEVRISNMSGGSDFDSVQFRESQIFPDKWCSVVPVCSTMPKVTNLEDIQKPIVVASSMDCSENPGPGLSVVRSIREGLGEAVHIVGLDTTTSSTGLSHDLLDSILLFPSRHDMSSEQFRELLRRHIFARAPRALLLPGSDLEIWDLARSPKKIPADNVAAPSLIALERTSKPDVEAVTSVMIGMRVPHSSVLDTLNQDWKSDAYQFGVKFNYPVIVKSKTYGAKKAFSYAEVLTAVGEIRDAENTQVVIQVMEEGIEESIAFCAHHGELLEACHMEKDNKKYGKAWGGEVRPLSSDMWNSLSELVKQLNWSGGGEIEMVVNESSGTMSVIDFNPRFPAWIHGASLNGFNLPSILAAKTLGLPMPQSQHNKRGGSFSRVTEEVRAKVVAIANVDDRGVAAKKARHRTGQCEEEDSFETSDIENDGLAADLDSMRLRQDQATPSRMWLPALKRTIRNFALDCRQIGIVPCMSIKTNPDIEVFKNCYENSYLAEAITGHEVKAALANGFKPSQIVLNGPGKFFGLPCLDEPLFAVNADSIQDFQTLVQKVKMGHLKAPHHIGIRLAPPGRNSRFGVELLSKDDLSACLGMLKELPGTKLAWHFHYASSSIGLPAWRKAAIAVLSYAQEVSDEHELAVGLVDLGGGWPADDAGSASPEAIKIISDVSAHARTSFGKELQIIIEPGKALTERAAILISRVREIRSTADGQAIIVDAAITDLPDLHMHPHPIYWSRFEGLHCRKWQRAPPGNSPVYGRVCMENDQLGHVRLPPELRKGDLIAIGNCGAYDWSMSYDFAYGRLGSDLETRESLLTRKAGCSNKHQVENEVQSELGEEFAYGSPLTPQLPQAKRPRSRSRSRDKISSDESSRYNVIVHGSINQSIVNIGSSVRMGSLKM